MAKAKSAPKEFSTESGATITDPVISDTVTGDTVASTDATASNEATVAGAGETVTPAPVVKPPRTRRTFTAAEKIIAKAELALKQAERDVRIANNEVENVQNLQKRVTEKSTKGSDSLAKLTKAAAEAAERVVLVQADADRAQALVDNFVEDDDFVAEEIKDLAYRLTRGQDKVARLTVKVKTAQDFLVSVGGVLPVAPVVETPATIGTDAPDVGLPETQPADEAVLAD